MLEEDDFNQEDYKFYEEITDESDADWETTKDEKVDAEISEGDVEILETMDKVDQHMEMLEGDAFNQEYFFEEITDKSDTDLETSKNKDVHSKMSEGDVEYFETIDGSEALIRSFQDLPDELILKVLSYSEPKDVIKSGQVSKRLRKISQDNSLWQRVNFYAKIVKTELLELILDRECKSLHLNYTTILGSLSLYQKSKLRELNLDRCFGNTQVLEEILASCDSLEKLAMQLMTITPKMAASICQNAKTLKTLDICQMNFGNTQVLEEILASCDSLEKLAMQLMTITPKMAASICQNAKTLKKLDIYWCIGKQSIMQIMKCCQELKEVNLAYINGREGLSQDCLEFIALHISPNVEMLDLSDLKTVDNHVKTLFSRCKKIKALRIGTYVYAVP